jgi:dienelactone hydrolase
MNFPHRLMSLTAISLLLIGSAILRPQFCTAADPSAKRTANTAGHTTAEPLPNTQLLELDKPLDEHLLAGIRRFCLRQLELPPARLESPWNRPDLSLDALDEILRAKRERFRAALGAVDPRLTTDKNADAQFEWLESLERSSLVARMPGVVARAVRWPVLEGVSAEGLMLVPDQIQAVVVAIPDADQSPEAFCGLIPGVVDSAQLPKNLAAAGCLVIVPTLISRDDQFSGHPRIGYTNLPHREFLYRQSFVAGRHIVGYEVQKVLAAIDLAERLRPRELADHARGSADTRQRHPLGVAGVGEGGLLAFYSAALDTRLDACWVAGYFDERNQVWREPIYRNIWGLLSEFDDAELAGLIAPRQLTIESCAAVEVAGPPAVREGRRASAAPGVIRTNQLPSVRAEFARAQTKFARRNVEAKVKLAVSGDQGSGPAGTPTALAHFLAGLGVTATHKANSSDSPANWSAPDSSKLAQDSLADESRGRHIAYRQQRQFSELQSHIQSVIARSHHVRDRLWRTNPPTTVEDWRQRSQSLREQVHSDLIGRLIIPPSSLNPSSRCIHTSNEYTAYEVRIAVMDEIEAGGVLLLPANLRQDEKRPVVVCQHGLESTAHNTFSHDPAAFRYYKAFAEQLVKLGYIVYSPQNPYRGGDRFREIQRMSNPLRRSLFTYIVAQHERTLDWLCSLPQVDSQRIGFYGLSYGGKTAMRVPPVVERYRVAICSGDFSDWPRTIASHDERYSYIFTGEYEIPEWNLAHIANYAELAMLMAPRPFMVEQGHRDGGAPSEWVASEFAKVARHYTQLGIGDRAQIAWFDGPHTIDGRESIPFLQRHLKP